MPSVVAQICIQIVYVPLLCMSPPPSPLSISLSLFVATCNLMGKEGVHSICLRLGESVGTQCRWLWEQNVCRFVHKLMIHVAIGH